MVTERIKVLLIEDDEDDFFITQKLFQRIEGTGYVINWINNYEDGLEALLSGEDDICLLDFRLGKRTGLELIREAFQQECKVPMILLTGQGDREIDLEAAKAGASDFMVKGQITADVLERSVRYSIERKKIEQARDAAVESARQAEEKYLRVLVQQSEEKYRNILETIEEGYFETNLNGDFTYLNNSLCANLGYHRDEVLGRNYREFVDETTEKKLYISFANILKTGQPISQLNWEVTRQDGVQRSVESSISLVRDAGDTPVGFRGLMRDVTERKEAEEQLLYDALHDSLTGVANRTLFLDHLQLAIDRKKRKPYIIFAVLFLDFDRFKVINDSLGHSEGDNLLKQIANRLKSIIRPDDLVARLGGDEFTILLNEINTEGEALQVAERIQEKLKSPFDLADREIFISASIGIALSTSAHTRAEDMIRDADAAMYRAKAKGKAQYQVFDQTMHKDVVDKLEFETDMRYALERGEFCIHYQPIINLETNRLNGFEALLRWNHPVRGMVSPMEFIPVAEDNGLIIPLGGWMIYESCRQLREWQSQNPTLSPITISVNLSSKEFLQSNLAEKIVAALASTRLSPSSLKLEITESYLLENSETAIIILHQLREIGVEISLDDFGTGFSSLSYLHRLPIDYLKIDRSFVKRMTEDTKNYEIVHTIIKLAQNLKIKVIAEGIETEPQFTQLRQLHCDFGQGFFFSRPLEAAQARQFIAEQNPFEMIFAERPVFNSELSI
jgi:diguanylate cyclase (GGDEF)-like protein/PAS domain S-box-containing protein